MGEKTYYKLTEVQMQLLVGAFLSVEPKKGMQDNLIGFGVYVRKDFDPDAMEKAFNCLLSRNDSLRLRLSFRINGLRQSISDYEPYVPLRRTVKNKAEFDAVIDDPQKNMPLFSEKLYRATLVSCEDEEKSGGIYVLVHHICCDGYSIRLMRRKLEDYYECYVKGKEPPEEKEYSILPYFEYEEKYRKSPQYKEDRKWWAYQYNHQPDYRFPAGRIPWRCSLDAEECETAGEPYAAFRRFCMERSYSVSSVILHLCALSVYCLTGDTNFCLYTLTHGRMTMKLRKTIGCMINSVPVFYRISEDDTPEEYLGRANGSYMEALAHIRFPASKQIMLALKETYIKRFGYNHMWFTFSSMEYDDKAEDGPFELVIPSENYLLGIFYCAFIDREEKQKMSLELSYQERLYSAEEAKKMLAVFNYVLDETVNGSCGTIRELREKFYQRDKEEK